MKYKAICIDNTDTDLILYEKYLVEYYAEFFDTYSFEVFDEDNYIGIYDIKRFNIIKEFRNKRIKQLI